AISSSACSSGEARHSASSRDSEPWRIGTPLSFLWVVGCHDLRLQTLSGVNLLERFDDDRAIDPGGLVGIGFGPLLGGLQGLELCHDQAAGKAGGARIIAVNGWVRAGQ